MPSALRDPSLLVRLERAMGVALALLAACSSASEGDVVGRRAPDDKGKAEPDAGPPEAPPSASSPPAPAIATTIQLSAPVAATGDPFEASRTCRDRSSLSVFVSPRRPTSSAEMRVIVVSEEPIADALVVAKGPEGLVPLRQKSWGGPPYAWSAAVTPSTGEWLVGLAHGADLLACRRARVRTSAQGLGGGAVAWANERGWDRGVENLYAAWIEHLFDAPARTRVGWRPLHELTRDRERNLLHDHLSLGEDDAATVQAIELQADCADVPYFLRAYFAWKLRLPFQWSRCEAESAWRAPVCAERFTNDQPRTTRHELQAFNEVLAQLADTVHSGNMRALPTDDAADFYPVALTRKSIRPGTVFADPYGHVMVVARWIPQAPAASGLLYAIDGNPDRSIGRKRFWRGAFVFGAPVWAGAAGFKAFRPIVQRDGAYVALTNREINGYAAYGNYSHEQYRLGTDGFYARVEELINPEALTPERAFHETFDALVELVQSRIRAIELGAAWVAAHAGSPIAMPEGPEIFESTGPWEDYSTPSRDLALLGAIDLIRGFGQAVVDRPSHYSLPAGQTPEAARTALETLLRRRARETRVTYTRSDGSAQTLSIEELLARTTALEVAYNPNDCTELRWGAAPGSPEAATCDRHAPAEQAQRMQGYRSWFENRTRPRRN